MYKIFGSFIKKGHWNWHLLKAKQHNQSIEEETRSFKGGEGRELILFKTDKKWNCSNENSIMSHSESRLQYSLATGRL